MSDYGRHLGRQEILALEEERTAFFKFADLLAAIEPNLSKRIKERYALV
jgi:hypothetical protein